MNAALAGIAREQQKELGELLGRLQERHKVGFSVPKFDPNYFPTIITLGDTSGDFPLEYWGSGTQNRTLILMTLFKARQITQAQKSASKITPIIVIEEPESFLHPSAQGEFGRLLQSLAEDFRVQVIVTTHSPFMLSLDRTESNILLERRYERQKIYETHLVDTQGERWMEPFALALGLNSDHFKPWKNAIFSEADRILMVEGNVDKDYFSLLGDESHGENKLKFDGEIFVYGGFGSLKSRVLLDFVSRTNKRVFITYDLDCEREVSPLLEEMGFRRQKDFIGIGSDESGKGSIEGLLPEDVVRTVYGREVDLVQKALNGTKEEQASAKNNLKRLLFEEFKKTATPQSPQYQKLYDVVKKINKAFQ